MNRVAQADGGAAAAAIRRGVDFETSNADLVRRSERRAWRVAASAAILALALAAGYVALLPLKQDIPFLVVADPVSGTATVARLEGDALDRQLTAGEALNRAYVAQFVTLRESYDHSAIRLRDWRVVHSMSSADVAADYNALYTVGNPANPDRVHGRSRAIRVRILSIVLLGGGEGRAPKGATVRFQRSLLEKRDASVSPLDNRIATLEFSYNGRLRMAEADRLNNPLGFQVTSYRTDEDFAATPPAAEVLPDTLPIDGAGDPPAAPARSEEVGP